ncbi:MAG: glycosyltransferase [Chthoniobacteraceae bacterium]
MMAPLPASPVKISGEPFLSVLICSRNPKPDYLNAVLEALLGQTLPLDRWELILVDNGSSPAIKVDLQWHPRARVVVEPEPGILAARLRAIQEAQGDLLCFFDDDTPPCADYLEFGVSVADSHPWLGAWGAAVIAGKFEVPVPEWAKPFLHMLALRNEKGNYWSNMEDWRTIPYSGGMVFRRSVGLEFLRWVEANRNARLLGRKANELLSHEDIALAKMAYRLDFGTGIFERLQLGHFIPASRLEPAYLCRLSEGFGYSGVLSKWINGENYHPKVKGRLDRIFEWVRNARKPAAARACLRADRRGARRALQYIAEQTGKFPATERMNPFDFPAPKLATGKRCA